MTPITAATAMSVVTPEIIIIKRIRATTRAAAGSRGRSSSDGALLMTDQPPGETITVDAEARGERLDRVLAARIEGVSRSRLKALILEGQVTIGGGTIRDPGYRVNAGDAIAVRVPAAGAGRAAGRGDPAHGRL